MSRASVLACLFLLAACGDDGGAGDSDAAPQVDAALADAGAPDAAVECTQNTDCPSTARCDVGDSFTCVSLLSTECTEVHYAPDIEASASMVGRNEVVFIGAIMPLSSPFEPEAEAMGKAVDLAMDEFNDELSLQDGRTVALVLCDSGLDSVGAEAAAAHLVNQVKAPAIIGPLRDEEVASVATGVTVPGGVLMMAPTASAPSLSSLSSSNLVWRVTPSDVLRGNALVDRLLFNVDPAPARVLLLSADTAYGNELRDQVQTRLANGVAPAVVYSDVFAPAESFANESERTMAYDQILSTALSQPGIALSAGDYVLPEDHYTHIVVIGAEESDEVVDAYLGFWAQLFTFANFPQFLVVNRSEEQVARIAGEIPAGLELIQSLVAQRLRGLSFDLVDEGNFTVFDLRYQLANDLERPPRSAARAYDATMALLLAMMSVPDGTDITGAEIAAGIGSFSNPSGDVVSFGDQVNTFLTRASSEITTGMPVNLEGITGALDWPQTGGEARVDPLLVEVVEDSGDFVPSTACRYELNSGMDTGVWLDLATGMPPCR